MKIPMDMYQFSQELGAGGHVALFEWFFKEVHSSSSQEGQLRLQARTLFKGAIVGCQIAFLKRYCTFDPNEGLFDGFGVGDIHYKAVNLTAFSAGGFQFGGKGADSFTEKVCKWLGLSASIEMRDFLISLNPKAEFSYQPIIQGAVKAFKKDTCGAQALLQWCTADANLVGGGGFAQPRLPTAVNFAVNLGAFDVLEWFEKEGFIKYNADGIINGPSAQPFRLDITSDQMPKTDSPNDLFYSILRFLREKGVNMNQSKFAYRRVLMDRRPDELALFAGERSPSQVIASHTFNEDLALCLYHRPPADLADLDAWKFIVLELRGAVHAFKSRNLFSFLAIECTPWMSKLPDGKDLKHLIACYRALVSKQIMPPKTLLGELYQSTLFFAYDADFSALIAFLAEFDCMNPPHYIPEIRSLLGQRKAMDRVFGTLNDLNVVPSLQSNPALWNHAFLRKLFAGSSESILSHLRSVAALNDPKFNLSPDLETVAFLLDAYDDADTLGLRAILDMFSYEKGSLAELDFVDLLFNRFEDLELIASLFSTRFTPDSAFLERFLLHVLVPTRGFQRLPNESIHRKLEYLHSDLLDAAFGEDLLERLIKEVARHGDTANEVYPPYLSDGSFLDLMRTLHGMGCPWSDRTLAAGLHLCTLYAPLPAFLHEERCPFSEIVVLEALLIKEQENDGTALEFLEKRGYDIFTPKSTQHMWAMLQRASFVPIKRPNAPPLSSFDRVHLSDADSGGVGLIGYSFGGS